MPAGWTSDGPKPVPAVTEGADTTVTFTVTPPADAQTNVDRRLAAVYTTGSATGYTDDVVRVVPAVEGRFQRWGKWREYDRWLSETAPAASRLGRSAAEKSMPLGGAITVPVAVHNWSGQAHSGAVSLDLPAGLGSPDASKPYGPLDPGDETTVDFELTSTGATLPAAQTLDVPILTTSEAGESSETLTMSIVPATTIPEAASAPGVDAVEGGDYSGPKLDISRLWQGDACEPGDCGGDSYAKLTRSGDDLYVFVHVVDDYQSYAVTPEECVGHWQADSVEILLDPRGNSSERNTDTASTFKLGVFPYTNDPGGTNGNGPNGPCWERDADNHQGYSTGPLADTVDDAPNAPGVEVASSVTWVGSNETTVDHGYAGDGYSLEVKIPLADLPAAVNPEHMGLNITPYDNDDTSAPGTTTLRHIDLSTRLGWSAFGSVQSDPFRWGVARLTGYTPPAGRPTEAPPANVSHPNLDGAESPQTIFTSARSGVPISGRDPADALTVGGVRLTGAGAEVALHAAGAGKARIYLWSGDQGQIPVYTTTCEEPAPDFGLTPCGTSDGGIPRWSPDQSGRVVASQAVDVTPGDPTVTIPLSAEQRARLQHDGSALISFETAEDKVQAFDVPLARPQMFLTATPGGTETGGRKLRLTAELTGPQPFPGTPGGAVRFQLDGVNVGDPVAVGDDGRATLAIDDPGAGAAHTFTAVYDGDWDYAPASATLTQAAGGGPPGPPGPRGPRGPRGRATVVLVTCKVSGRRTVKCRIAPVGSKARTTTTIRVGSRSKRRTHKGAYTVTLHTKRRVKRSVKVRVTVRRGSARTKITVRAGRARVVGV